MRERAQFLTVWVYGVWVERIFLAGLLTSNILMGLGSAWDFHWHEAVGRDSFWIPPHMLMYTGGALATVLVFLFALRTSADVRSTRPLAVFHSLNAQGYGVVGIGGATMTVAAGFDEFWHRTIGDFTIWSPPHVMGVVGGIIIGLGTLIALLHANRRQILFPPWGRTCVLGIVAGVIVAAYFGLVPAAVMAFLPEGENYRFFTTKSPYFVAVLASLTVPIIVTGVRRVLGRRGFELAALVGFGFWCLQEAFHQVVTPLVAEAFSYVVRHPYGLYNLRFDLLVLGFMMLPPLAVNRLAPGRPWFTGAFIALFYTAEVAAWLGLLGTERNLSVLTVVVISTLGALSAVSGSFCGQWIRRVAALE